MATKADKRQVTVFEFLHELDGRHRDSPQLSFGEFADHIQGERVIDFRSGYAKLRFFLENHNEETLCEIAVHQVSQGVNKTTFKIAFRAPGAETVWLPLVLLKSPSELRKVSETTLARFASFFSRNSRERLRSIVEDGFSADFPTEEQSEEAAPAPETENDSPSPAEAASTGPTSPSEDETKPANPDQPAQGDKWVPEMDPDFPVRIRST